MLHTSLLLPTILPSQTSFSAHNTLTTNLSNDLTRLQLSSLAYLHSFSATSTHNNFFFPLLSSSFLQCRSPHAANPTTVLLPPTSFLLMFSWMFSKFLHVAFPPVHHTLKIYVYLCPPPAPGFHLENCPRSKGEGGETEGIWILWGQGGRRGHDGLKMWQSFTNTILGVGVCLNVCRCAGLNTEFWVLGGGQLQSWVLMLRGSIAHNN